MVATWSSLILEQEQEGPPSLSSEGTVSVRVSIPVAGPVLRGLPARPPQADQPPDRCQSLTSPKSQAGPHVRRNPPSALQSEPGTQ